MNDAQKYLLNNMLNDRHLNDDATMYTSDAMINYADRVRDHDKLHRNDVLDEAIEAVRHVSNNVAIDRNKGIRAIKKLKKLKNNQTVARQV